MEAVASEIFDHEVEGAIKCKAPGCPNWFRRQGNRHRYCKGPNCTYKRGVPAEQEVTEPEGAAEELLRRLQGEESGEVGPAMLVTRRKAVQVALRARDPQALSGALIDEAAACVWWADRAARSELPGPTAQAAPGGPLAAAQEASPGKQPIGLVHAVISSHQRTAHLAQHRHELLWALLHARDELSSAMQGVNQTAGSPQEADAQVVLEGKRAECDRAERAFEAAEAAWKERMLSLRDLVGGANAVAA